MLKLKKARVLIIYECQFYFTNKIISFLNFNPEEDWLKNNYKSLIESIAICKVQLLFSISFLLNQPSFESLLKSNIFISLTNLTAQIHLKRIQGQFWKNKHIKNKISLSNRTSEEKKF
ncbi:unnamed protein product [Paramecium sonneborni]|uniref:Uncharacterized protein n=1 Tax=Paramecium sonneborni TaxID=65129 RepID=A0A8S1LKK7_9CILI|nr:unnamed protein product [Paramecium sonneborni]